MNNTYYNFLNIKLTLVRRLTTFRKLETVTWTKILNVWLIWVILNQSQEGDGYGRGKGVEGL